MFGRTAGRRALVALAAVVAASVAVGAGSASARRADPPGHKDANQCLWFSGVDVNELFGVPDQFHHSFLCKGELSAGEHWRPFVSWIAGDGVDSVYPAGYVPLRPLPIEDFVAKLTVKVVTDGEPVAADQLVRRLADLVDRERQSHVQELGRVV